jgi:hypothetical protein
MEAVMWWWNDYGPWMFGPFFMIIAFIFCAITMFVMMRGMMGGHRGRSELEQAIAAEQMFGPKDVH